MDYTALQVKTSYSILESLNNISELVRKASELGYTSLSITDNGNLFGVMEFYLECKKYNIKPIIGIEIVLEDSKLLLYAINELGYKKLINISMKYNDKLLSVDYLKDNDNLVLVMPYLSFDKSIYDIFKYKYVGYSSIEEKLKIDGLYDLVYINDVSYLEKDDYKYLDYVYMIKEGKVLGKYKLNTHKGKHLLTYEEVIQICSKNDILNTKKISDMCNVEFNYNNDLLPVYDKNIDSYEYLSTLCNEGLKKRLNNEVSSIYQ